MRRHLPIAILLAWAAVPVIASATALIGTWFDHYAVASAAAPQSVRYVGGTPTPTPTCGSGNWELAAPFPFSGTRMAVASDGVFAYAAGGVTVPQQNTMYRYDPVADSWSAMANMPSAFSSSRAVYASVTNSIYVFGGLSITVPNLNTTYIYNVGTNTWTTGAPMPSGRSLMQVAYYAPTNKIYVIGGIVSAGTGNTEQSEVWEYDPATNTWDTTRQNAPQGIGGAAVGIQGQYIYIAGGSNFGQGRVNHYRYDIVNNAWASLAPLPIAIYYPVGASVGGKNYVIGGGNPSRPGESPDAAFRSTFIYDPVTDTWATGPSTNVGHAQAGGTAIGNRLLVVGGLPGGGGSTDVAEMYIPPAQGCPTPTPVTPTPTPTPATPSPTPTPPCEYGSWAFAAAFPFAGVGMAVASDGVFAYAAGGDTGFVVYNTMYRYDPNANSWSALANMPAATSHSRAVYSPVTNSIYVFGGSSQNNANLDITYIYSIGTNSWTTGAPMPDGRNNVQAAYDALTNKIYVIGGILSLGTGGGEQSQVWEYDPAANTWNASRQDAPRGIGGGSVGIQGQYIYIAGGAGTSYRGTTNNYRYDIANDSWTLLAPLPIPIYHGIGATAGGRNYVIGGSNQSALSSTFVYDPAIDVWTYGPSTNVAHAQTGGTAIGNRLIVVGGNPGGCCTNTVEINAVGGVCPTPTPFTPTPTPTPTPSLTPTPMTPTPTPTPTPSPCAPGQWMFRANYPIGIYEVAVTTDGSYVYAFGGRTGSPLPVPVAAANRYDPLTDTWTALAPMSSGPDNLMGAEYGGNGKIYVMGGAAGPALNRIYDIPSNTWSLGSPIPVGRPSFEHAYYNGKIYVIGGISGGTAVYAYDIASNTWTTRASLPQPRNGTAAGVIDGRIYVAPGYQSNTLFIYNIAADSWSVGPSVQVSDSGTAGAVVARKLWVIGGNDAPILIYDPSVSAWSIGPSLNQRRSYPGAATIISQGGETAVVVGGNDNGSFIPRNTVEASSIYGCPTPTPSPTPTITPFTPSPTPTPSPSPPVTPFTPSPTPSSPGGSPTPSPTASSPGGSPTPTPTPSSPPSPSPGISPTPTPSPVLRFCNGQSIDMDLNGPGVPYPSTITVAGGPASTGGLIVTLNSLWHQFPDNIDVLLVGPNGAKYVLMADAGGAVAIPQNAPVTLTFRDYLPTALPDNGPLTTGNFVPTTWETPVTSFPPTAPAAPYVEPGPSSVRPIWLTMFGNYGMSDPNGVWNLYVRDDGGNPFSPEVVSGSISGGWCLEIIPPTAAAASIAGRVTTAQGAGIRNARVTITGNTLREPRVVTTGSFGFFSFEGLTAGETYVVTVNSRRYTFSAPSRVITLLENVVDADFIANE